MTREAEEESLFYVALSRAEDTINLSRAPYHGGGGWSNVPPSPYLFRIASHLPKRPDSPPVWRDSGVLEPHELPFAPAEQSSWPATAIETYISCPRRFYYEHILGMDRSAVATPYLNLNKAVRSTIAWMQSSVSDEERKMGVEARFAADWEQSGLRGHALETIYKTAAKAMLTTAGELVTGASLTDELTFRVNGDVSISCRADHVVRTPASIEIFRFKLSRLTGTEKSKIRYGVIQAALRQRYPDVSVEFEHVSLLSGERRWATLQGKRLAAEIKKLTEAIEGITSGGFEAAPNDYDCPRCPFFFVCPTHARSRR
jgi:DNA helicase-2/ATP-dependent DNA helicase PcrA